MRQFKSIQKNNSLEYLTFVSMKQTNKKPVNGGTGQEQCVYNQYCVILLKRMTEVNQYK